MEVNNGLTLQAERVLSRERCVDVTQFHRRKIVVASLAALRLAANALDAVAERLALDASEYAVCTSKRRLEKKDGQ